MSAEGRDRECVHGGGAVRDFQQVSPSLVPCQPEGGRKRLACLGQALGKCALETPRLKNHREMLQPRPL